MPTPGTTIKGTHSLGLHPGSIDFVLECLIAEREYAIGDRLQIDNIWGFAVTNNQQSPTLSTTRTAWSFKIVDSFQASHK